jgi:paraquat-inducible protein A
VTDNTHISLPRPLLIRGLVVASLTLLITGAVTPLLTTERFYFFSNTFSLASGLRQLVANDQVLIAAVVALFSLCVPVVKAVVIWIAASPHAPRSLWLVMADRFGKWSMLEVFIAALLIVALKLGPVVDATLHYGAWLLAASVLLAGIASQLLAHEPHSKPLFSIRGNCRHARNTVHRANTSPGPALCGDQRRANRVRSQPAVDRAGELPGAIPRRLRRLHRSLAGARSPRRSRRRGAELARSRGSTSRPRGHAG